MADPLQVHVFGGAVGECIVLGLPEKRWAVIDVYLADLSNPSASPIIQLLEKQGVRELEFLCLTHPHEDHYRGVSYLTRNYRIRRFIGFGAAIPQQHYNQIVKVLTTKARRLNYPSHEMEVVSDLSKALALIRAKVKAREMVSDPVSVTSRILDEVVGPEKLCLRMVAIAPSGRSVQMYEDQLCACFDKQTPGKILVDHLRGVEDNVISSAFILEYGKQRVILGGDVETEGWKDILERPSPKFDLVADLIKVSHHGSKNGYCDRLWEEHLSPKKSATAVLTAFSPAGLPKPKGLAYLTANCKHLVTTSMTSLKPGLGQQKSQSPFASMPLDAQIALKTLFKNASPVSTALGLCSFTLDGGAAITENLSGDAGVIS